MVIQHNLSAMNSHRYMGINNSQTSSNLEKLSSGYKVNRAADDAAGLAISEKMRGQIRGLAMAEQNTSHGVNLIQTAEGGLNETHAILQRMRELAVQSSNGTYQDVDRDQLTKEFEALKSEVDRISESIHYNNIKLLDGSLSEKVQATITADKYNMIADISVSPSNLAGTTLEIDIGTFAAAVETPAEATKNALALTLDVGNLLANDTLTLKIGNTSYALTLTTAMLTGTTTQKETAINAAFASLINADTNALYTAAATATGVTITAKDVGAGTIDGIATTLTYNNLGGGTATTTIASTETAGKDKAIQAATLTGATIKVTEADGTSTTGNAAVLYDHDTKTFVLSDSLGNTFTINTEKIYMDNQTATVALLEGKNLTFQIGANGGQDQRVNLSVDNMSSKNLGLKSGNVMSDGSIATSSNAAFLASASINTIDNANKAIEIIHAATNQVSGQRAELGALQNRLESTLNSLGTTKENLTAAESTIRDTDMAYEMMEFTKNNILTQAAQAMLAQANQLPQGVLQLLR